MVEMLKQSKSVVFAGESVGGAVASLSALWLLSNIQTAKPVLCITFGSPMLGNESFSQAILQERRAANFCHIVAPRDIVPRLPFVDGDGDGTSTLYCPFGSYIFCTDRGAICLDNATAVVNFLHFTRADADQDHHLDYAKLCCQYFENRFTEVSFSESNNEAGIALALHSSGISSNQEASYGKAMRCLAKARQCGWRRNLNNAKMAVSLAKISPCRAELEWYKAFCDHSDQHLGYYDSFKTRGASKREFKVNMNRIRLGRFWDDVIDKLKNNHLTHDFHKLLKYVNASQSYKLLVEPLEIAEYYRARMHLQKGHYIEHGREKRFKIFDRWWGDRKVGAEQGKPRSKYAGLTQDSCFWARVEEATDFVYDFARQTDPGRRLVLLDKIEKFQQYASGMIERKEVSFDVLLKNSSYSLFTQQWRGLKSQ